MRQWALFLTEQRFFLEFSTAAETFRGLVALNRTWPTAVHFPIARRRLAMFIHVTKPLFAWEELDDSPTLHDIQLLLAALPDAKLLESLRIARGKGRNDYPVRVLWGVEILRIALRHIHMEDCLAELRRNAGLRRLIGIDHESQVPAKWNMSRFEETLGEEPHRSHLKEIFNVMMQKLAVAVPDLGVNVAGDATALNARRKRNEKAQEAEKNEGLPQPSGGRKVYEDDDGKVTKVVEWFGYKLHLIVDVKHEVVLAYHITDTKAGDGETLSDLLHGAQQNLPEGRIKTLAYDKAADTNDVHELLHGKGIKPLIQIRSMWKSEPERMLPGHDGNSNIVYHEDGSVHCYDRVSAPMVKHKMAYIGHEPAKGTIKYRCPAKHEGWDCPMSKICNAGKEYGKTVRVLQETDLRRFPSLPRATKKFETLYKGRTSIERVNARLKLFWGVDDGNVNGAKRFTAQVGMVLIVHAAFATLLAAAPRYEGTKRPKTLGQTRLSTIAKALRAASPA
jgi:IS5 family transposase